MLRKNQSGAIGVLEVILIVVVLAAAGVVYWRVNEADKTVNSTEANTSNVSTVYSNADKDENEVALVALEDQEGEGTVTASYDGTTFKMMVEAHLTDPADGKHYEVWFVKDGSDVSAGELTKDGDHYALDYSSEVDYSGYSVVVTLEPDGTELLKSETVLPMSESETTEVESETESSEAHTE